MWSIAYDGIVPTPVTYTLSFIQYLVLEVQIYHYDDMTDIIFAGQAPLPDIPAFQNCDDMILYSPNGVSNYSILLYSSSAEVLVTLSDFIVPL